MKMAFLFALATIVVSNPSDIPISLENAQTVDEGRRFEISQSNFDACELKNPVETWVYWDNVLSEDDQELVRSSTHSELIKFHFGWGMGIRNGLCLWKGGPLQQWFYENGVQHPDSMSHKLIELYWAHLNDCDPDAAAFVATGFNGDTSLLHCPTDISFDVEEIERD